MQLLFLGDHGAADLGSFEAVFARRWELGEKRKSRRTRSVKQLIIPTSDMLSVTGGLRVHPRRQERIHVGQSDSAVFVDILRPFLMGVRFFLPSKLDFYGGRYVVYI